MYRYAAKLLFQFRVVVGGDSGKRRTCEERIVLLNAASANEALSQAKRRGRKSKNTYMNGDGNPVHFEFIGVVELLRIDSICAEDEVWYEIVERLLPSERKDRLIPPESELNAIRNKE